MKRPFGLNAIIILQIVSGVISLALMVAFVTANDLVPAEATPLQAATTVLNLLSLVIAFGLWRLKRWAWVLNMVQVGLLLALYLTGYLAGEPSPAMLALNVSIVFYLNQPNVKAIFERKDARAQAGGLLGQPTRCWLQDEAGDIPITSDINLLRCFEPVLRFTHGELFFPCAVDEYLKRCSLWIRDPAGNDHRLVAAGALDKEKLAEYEQIPTDFTLYLRFVQAPLEGRDYQRWRSGDRPRFHAPGRLARVGMVYRLLDILFNLSLLIRGNVPGGTAAAADVQYRQMRQTDDRFVYYGRVLREGGYIILHYMFFYAMNNWRSGFYGLNDHEADWEQIFVYLSDEADPKPLWVACASHDFAGDDLRRRWDDPTLEVLDGTHPVIYTGAGSHASYFERGEYEMSSEIQLWKPLRNLLNFLSRLWEERLKPSDTGGRLHTRVVREVFGEQFTYFYARSDRMGAINVPFVDYARGDGPTIGPGQPDGEWSPVLLDRVPGWVENYRGLWGLDTKDPFGGERAPAGPKYARSGAMRQSWHNPLGWPGLHKVTPPHQAERALRAHIAELERDLEDVEEAIHDGRAALRLEEIEVRALQETEYLEQLYLENQAQLGERERALNTLYARRADLRETIEACQKQLDLLRRGVWGDPRAHIQHAHHPDPPQTRQSRGVEIWAALSTGLLLILFAVSLIFDPASLEGWVLRIVGAFAAFTAIEALLRGQLFDFLLNVTVVLALVSALVLAVNFFWLLIFVGLVALARVLIVENLREIRGG